MVAPSLAQRQPSIRSAVSALVMCVFIGLSACTSAGSDATPPATSNIAADSTVPEETPWRLVEVMGANGVVTTGSRLGGGYDGNGTWVATNADLETFEQLLPAALSKQGLDEIADQLDQYTRWYSALEYGDQQLLIVLFSCIHEADDYRDHIPYIDDGGDCVFEAKYDPADKSIRWIYVNGEA